MNKHDLHVPNEKNIYAYLYIERKGSVVIALTAITQTKFKGAYSSHDKKIHIFVAIYETSFFTATISDARLTENTILAKANHLYKTKNKKKTKK